MTAAAHQIHTTGAGGGVLAGHAAVDIRFLYLLTKMRYNKNKIGEELLSCT